MDCTLCCRQVLPHEKVIRIIVEEVSRDKEKDEGDPAYFSNIEDWDVVVLMHSSCARNALRQGKDVPYSGEVSKLGVGQQSIDKQHQLRLVEGGSF